MLITIQLIKDLTGDNDDVDDDHDADDCRNNIQMCSKNAVCMESLTQDLHICKCKDGFSGDGVSCRRKRKVHMFRIFRFFSSKE